MEQIRNDDTLKERVTKLEINMKHICETVDLIKNNELRHIDAKVDKLNDKFNDLDKKVEVMAVKVGLIVAVITTIVQTFLKVSL